MARKNVLITLGRLPKALELARALNAAGCRVIVADPFRSHLCKPSNAVSQSYRVQSPVVDLDGFRRDLLKIINDEKIDLVVPVSEEALGVASIADDLPQSTRLLGASLSQLEKLTDKFRFIETCVEANLSAPQTYKGDTPEALSLLEKNETVSKPRFGCSGGNVQFHRSGAVVDKTRLNQKYVFQKRIFGKEISSLSYCKNGQVVTTALYRGLAFAGTVATAFQRVDGAHAAREWIKQFVAEDSYSGFIAFDLIIDDEGAVWPIECNPRLTSGIHFMEPRSLAAAVLEGSQQIGVKQTRRFQEGHTTLALAYRQIFNPTEFWRRLQIIFSTRDVLWGDSDRLPFWLMTPMSAQILNRVIFNGESFGKASTKDIAWSPPLTEIPSSDDRPTKHMVLSQDRLAEDVLHASAL